MRYEIEILRKQNGLEDLSEKTIDGESVHAQNGEDIPLYTSRTQRFILGALGGALLPLMKIVLAGNLGPGRPWATYIGMVAGVALVACVGGVIALLLGNRATPRWACPLLGLSGSLVLMSLLSAAISPLPSLVARR
jgi:hypothetical protein